MITIDFERITLTPPVPPDAGLVAYVEEWRLDKRSGHHEQVDRNTVPLIGFSVANIRWMNGEVEDRVVPVVQFGDRLETPLSIMGTYADPIDMNGNRSHYYSVVIESAS